MKAPQPAGPQNVIRPPVVRRRISFKRMRRIFIVLALLASVAFVVDSLLVSVGFTRLSHRARLPEKVPLVTLTPSIVRLGQVVQLHLSHFTPSSQVLLTRDVQEPMRLDRSSALIYVDKAGDVDLHILVEGRWNSGSHFIEAEDASSRYTASTALQVIGAGSVLPPQVQLSDSALDMGTDWQGANTLHTIELQNNGGGTISWSASSDQRWLQFAPAHGVFSDSQALTIAVTRANLRAGDYQGTVKIISNTGMPAFVQVKMSVRALPANAGPVLVVTPPVLSFTTIDGATNPSDQVIRISNPGSSPLAWSLAAGVPTASVNQSIPFQSAADWLGASPSSGMVASGASASISIRVRAHTLFPSIYTGLLKLTAGQKSLNSPQSVAVSVDVQQHCGVVPDVGSMSFIALASQHTTDTQRVSVNAAPGCYEALPWSAFSLVDWLSVTPANGQVEDKVGAVTTVGIAGDLLQPGTFTGFLVFLTEQHTQTIMVQLTVLSVSSTGQSSGQSMLAASPASDTSPMHSSNHTSSTPVPGGSNTSSGGTSSDTSSGAPLPASPPLLSVSPAELRFSMTQGQTAHATQGVTVANAGGSTFNWQPGTNGSIPSWLTLTPPQGSVSAGQTAALSINANAGSLAPGTYNTQISITAFAASGVPVSGSPQVLPVTLNVLPPCTLQVTAASLSFASSLLQPQPPDQSISVKVTGTCSLPVSWQASADSGSRTWLLPSPSSGNENGTGSAINVHVDTSGKLLGRYNGQITFSAQDSAGSPLSTSLPTVSVTLSVLG